MKTTISNTNQYRFASIAQNDRVFYAKYTVDIHQSHTTKQTVSEQLYTDMLLSGTKKYSRQALLDKIALLGASIDITAAHSRVSITLRCTTENTEELLSLLEEILLSPNFSTRELKRAKTLLKNELIEYAEDAKSQALNGLVNTLYSQKDRRHADTVSQMQKEIVLVNMSDIRKIHASVMSHFWYVTCGGTQSSINHAANTLERCKQKQKHLVSQVLHKQKQPVKKVVLQNIPSKQNIEFSIGGSLPITLHHPDYIPFVFGLNVLGKMGGFSGRLMSTVREKEGLTYGIYARTETVTGVEQGYWRIMTFFAPKQVVQGLQSTLREITLISKEGVTNEEYTRFKKILSTQQILLQDSLIASIEFLHGYIVAGFTLPEIEQQRQKIQMVTRKEVNDALAKYMHTDSLVISGAGPVVGVKKEIDALGKRK